MSIHDDLRNTESGDTITLTINSEDDVNIDTITGTVTYQWDAPDTGYGDGEIELDMDAEWDDVNHVVDMVCISVRAGTTYSGAWNDPIVTGITCVMSDDDPDVIEEQNYVKLGTLTSIETH